MDDRQAQPARFHQVPVGGAAFTTAIRDRHRHNSDVLCADADADFVCAALNAASRREKESTLFTTDQSC